ncbi:hypothetical protein GGI07_001998 [Coemansia sp. Benny D115]|nr:hypothetical protein GGI07_001998 [Coemansia sp. Benny D115]
MISAASVHSFAERKTKNLFNMRPGWLKKDAAAETATAAVSSPDSPKIKELASSLYGKPKALSRPRIRELLTIAMIRLMERMIAELFPCADDDNAGFAGAGQAEMPSGTPLPSFEEFLKHICRRTRTPLTCMCLALLYLTRLRANHPRSRGSPGSSYRLALSSLCVATKYLYDDAYHTCSWVQVSMGLFSQREVNQMEMEFMYFLRYQLGVTPTEWNQWIATLEAKLVARWQEKGKAEVIYGFGLFLSYECCEASAQEAVRDIAWGEGGKSLLALLSNAIHSTGAVGESKGSPSADSAVSDTTCLPTPDPNAWFRIRSPALSGNDDPSGINVSQAFRATGSTSITPTSAQMTEVADPSRYMAAMSKAHPVSAPGCSSSAYGDQKQESSHYGHQKHGYDAGERRHGSWTSHPPFVHHGAGSSGHSHSMRPSSVCSVPALPTTTAASYSEGNMRHVVGVGSHSTTYRHASDSKSNDWRLLHPARQAHSSCEPSPLPQHQQNWQGASVNIQTQCNGIPPPRLAHLGSESTMVANVHGARHRVNMDSPFNSFSEITATMSLSYSGDSRDDGVLGSADHVVLNVRRTSGCGGGNGSSTTHCYSGTRPSSIAISSGLRVGSANPNTGFDSKSVYSGTSMLSKSGSSGGAIPGLSGSLIPNNVHSQSSQGTLNAFSGGSATNGPAKRGSAGKHSGATRPTARRATGSSSMAPSLNAASPSAERQGNNSRHTGGLYSIVNHRDD